MSLADLRTEHLIRTETRHNGSQYYRIKTQYVHTAVIQLSSFKRKTLKNNKYSEKLNIFNGKIIERTKSSEKQYTSLYEDHRYCAKLAIPNTVIDYMVKHCDETGVDFWSLDWIETKFKFYKNKVRYFCRVDFVNELTREEADQRIDLV